MKGLKSSSWEQAEVKEMLDYLLGRLSHREGLDGVDDGAWGSSQGVGSGGGEIEWTGLS